MKDENRISGMSIPKDLDECFACEHCNKRFQDDELTLFYGPHEESDDYYLCERCLSHAQIIETDEKTRRSSYEY